MTAFFNFIDTTAGGSVAPADLERAFLAAYEQLRQQAYRPVPLPPHPQVVTFRAMPWQLPVVNDPRSIDHGP